MARLNALVVLFDSMTLEPESATDAIAKAPAPIAAEMAIVGPAKIIAAAVATTAVAARAVSALLFCPALRAATGAATTPEVPGAESAVPYAAWG